MLSSFVPTSFPTCSMINEKRMRNEQYIQLDINEKVNALRKCYLECKPENTPTRGVQQLNCQFTMKT